MIEALIDGVVSERWIDETRTYERLDPSGAILEERPFTEQENAEADERAAHAVQVENALSIREQARASLNVLLASIDTLQAVTAKANNQITPGDTKDVARESRRIARQVIALSRLILNELDSDDIGD